MNVSCSFEVFSEEIISVVRLKVTCNYLRESIIYQL